MMLDHFSRFSMNGRIPAKSKLGCYPGCDVCWLSDRVYLNIAKEFISKYKFPCVACLLLAS